MGSRSLKIIAGPCSIDERNIEEIFKIAAIKVKGKNAIAGTRIVGLKSRTAFDKDGKGMGIDFNVVTHNIKILQNGGTVLDLKIPPSIKFMQKVLQSTDLLVATEVVLPFIQLSVMVKELQNGRVLIWNPSVNQLGWLLWQTAQIIKGKSWLIGLKNGKWVGTSDEEINTDNENTETPVEMTWQGLVSYAIGDSRKVLIHRGFEMADKQGFRARPSHEAAKRVKRRTNIELYFDPSHSFGPDKRSEIVKGTVEAMKLMSEGDRFLYDGVLIEVGTSETDTHQHITIEELNDLVDRLSEFRELSTDM